MKVVVDDGKKIEVIMFNGKVNDGKNIWMI